MSLSAKRLGQEYGLTAEEMNVLLKEEGFLDGKPGEYYPIAVRGKNTHKSAGQHTRKMI